MTRRPIMESAEPDILDSKKYTHGGDSSTSTSMTWTSESESESATFLLDFLDELLCTSIRHIKVINIFTHLVAVAFLGLDDIGRDESSPEDQGIVRWVGGLTLQVFKAKHIDDPDRKLDANVPSKSTIFLYRCQLCCASVVFRQNG
jgi:hypothetical protein